jgi:hypothetical protein
MDARWYTVVSVARRPVARSAVPNDQRVDVVVERLAQGRPLRAVPAGEVRDGESADGLERAADHEITLERGGCEDGARGTGRTRHTGETEELTPVGITGRSDVVPDERTDYENEECEDREAKKGSQHGHVRGCLSMKFARWWTQGGV